MKLGTSYIDSVLPYLNRFKSCSIYKYELNQIEKALAESVNTKTIYNALDIPDFKYSIKAKMDFFVLKHAIHKMNLFEDYDILKNDVYVKGKRFSLLSFEMGTLPEIKDRHKNYLVFMFKRAYEKVYYCGKIYSEDLLNMDQDAETNTDFFEIFL